MNTLEQAVNIWYNSSNTTNIIVVLLMLAVLVFFFFLVPYEIVEIKKRKRLKEEFFKKAKEYGLSDLETSLLWKHSKDYRWNIALVFNNKKVFDIISSKIIKEDISYSRLVDEMRHKLGFDKIPWFLPISTTKDIDLYQSGQIAFNNRHYEAVVWDKDKNYIYIALYSSSKPPIKVGDYITFSFMTQDYAKTSFSSKVVGISEDAGRIVYKIEHSDKITKIPIRDAVRVELSLKAYIYIPTNEELESYEKEKILPEPEEDKLIEGIIKDLSIGGSRFCTTFSFQELQKIFIAFKLYDKNLLILGSIRNKFDAVDHYCYGIKFEDLTKDQEDYIRSYIVEQQRLLVKSYRLGET